MEYDGTRLRGLNSSAEATWVVLFSAGGGGTTETELFGRLRERECGRDKLPALEEVAVPGILTPGGTTQSAESRERFEIW